MLAPSLLSSWEWSTYDARMRLRGPAPASPHIVLIGRDDASEARFGKGIWDRVRFAQVIEGLGKAGAAVVAPDFYFAGTSPPERGGAASDKALIRATRQAGNMVYPQSSPPLLPAFGQHARGVGHIVAVSDDDGIYRSVPTFLTVNGAAVPAFGVAIAAAFMNVPPNQTTIAMPLDAQGRLLIDYAGRWTDGLFAYFSFVDVVDAIEEGRVDELRKQVGGKIVLILHAAADGDKRRTPLEATAPGGFIHANVVNTIVTGRSLRSLGPAETAAITVGTALLAAGLVVACSGWTGLGWVGAFAFGYAGLAHVMFGRGGVVLPVLAPLLAVTVALVIGYLHRYLAEQRGRQWTQHAFSRYLGATVADRLAADESALRLGGEEREITVMFADLSNFTKLSTEVAPHVLSRYTNRYFGYIVEQIEATGGYVVQFAGDCVLAIWGAPLANPTHAVSAAKAAMGVISRVAQAGKEDEAKGAFSFSVRVSMNSGPALVGNIGSKTRFNYAAVGETVNIAARIEGVAGAYACRIAVGPMTAKLLEETFLLRELDVVRVKGKDAPIAVSEVLAERASATSAQVACARLYGEALALYRARRFTEAAGIWEKIARDEQDNPSAKMAERARSFQANPPAPSWDGVWVLVGK